jgi:hypothetical protein
MEAKVIERRPLKPKMLLHAIHAQVFRFRRYLIGIVFRSRRTMPQTVDSQEVRMAKGQTQTA